MTKGSKSKQQSTTIHHVRLKSLKDLARNVLTFGGHTRPIYSIKEKGHYRLFAPGIKLGDVRLVFYAETKEKGNFLMYQPGTQLVKENAEVKGAMLIEMQGRGIHNIPIIELNKNPYTEDKKAKEKVTNIEVLDYFSIIRGVIQRSLEDETIGKVYAFKHKSIHYIGTFTLMEEEETRNFCYAKTDFAKDYSFFRYNYTTDTAEPADVFGEHSYLYVRIINLEEAFSFFKPE